MVRLIVFLLLNKLIIKFKFQFHDGTIDRSKQWPNIPDSKTFQFHDGTIDRFFQCLNFQRIQEFQFHDGTIDSKSTLHTC